MATLFNTKISATYTGLFKTIDNAVLSASLKELTDGSGNQSGLFLNTAGDFKVTSVLEWGSLKDTGTGVTITQFVTAANGIENFNNDTTLPTSAAVKLYVDTKFSQTDTLTEVLGFGNTTSGKDIAVSAGDDITFTDTSKILMGAGSDLQIFHDGSNSFIQDLGTGNLKIQTNGLGIDLTKGSTEFLAKFIIDGGNELYFNNVKKFETTLLGSTVTGDLLVTGTISGSGGSFLPLAGGTMTGNTIHNDNVKSLYGTSSDLQIFHDGSNSFINETGTGNLFIQADTQIRLGSISGEKYARFNLNGNVELFYDNAIKLATTNTGVSVTGALSTTTNVSVGANATFVDSGKAIFGAGSDLQIYHDGSNSFITNTGGSLIVRATNFAVQSADGTDDFITTVQNAQINLFYNSSKKFETLTDGAKVTGNLEVTGTITGAGGSFLPLIGGTMTGNTIHNDNVKSIYGTASDGLEIFHDGSNSFIKDTGTGFLVIKTGTTGFLLQNNIGANVIQTGGNTVFLRYGESTKFETTNTGISVTGNGAFTGSVSIPDAGQLQLGTGNGLKVFHNSASGFLQNSIGDLFIDQATVTQAIKFRVSNSSALDTTALTINREGDLITGADVTIAGDLTVNGTTTTVNSQTLSVVDPLISLATANTANSLDIGFYGKYNDSTNRYLGLFNDASDSNKFKLFRGTTVEPTTTVNVAGAGYVAADLVIAGLEATTGVFSTSVTVAAASPLFRLTDTDNNTNIDLLSIGGAFILNSTSDQIYQIGGTEKFRIASSTSTFAGNVTAARGFFNAGAANVVATFTSTDATSTLQCIDIGGNVEFGASGNNFVVQPAGGVAQLTVGASTSTFAGDIKINNTTPYLLNNDDEILTGSDAGGYYFGLVSSANSSKSIQIGDHNSFIRFDTDGGERMRIDASGNVGIGTTTPNRRLEVSEASNGNIALFTNTVDADLNINLTSGVTLLAPSTGILAFGRASTETMRIAANSNVGIGTISPTEKLNVAGNVKIGTATTGTPATQADDLVIDKGASESGITLISTAASSIRFGDAANTSIGSIEYNHNSNYLRFSTNNAERMRIDSNGKVGIGAPSIDGNSTLQVQNDSGNCLIRVRGGSSSIAGIDFGDSGDIDIAGIRYHNSSNFMQFNVNASERMRIDASGQTTLSNVAGNTLTLTKSNGASLNFNDSTGIRAGIHALNGADGMAFLTGSAQTERMRIDSSGNVGIGTASPTEKLSVDGNLKIFGTDTAALQFENAVNGTRFHYLIPHYSASDSSLNSLEFKVSSSTAGNEVSVMTLNGAGNTTFAGTINSVANTNSGFLSEFKNISTGASAYSGFRIRNSDGGFAEFWRNSTAKSGTGNAALSLNIYNSADVNLWSGETHTMALVGNNVGIGDLTPSYPLVVSKSSSSTSNGDDSSVRLMLTNTNTTVNNYSLISFNDATNQGSSGALGLQYTDHTNNYGDLCFITRGAGGYGERMRITSSGIFIINQTTPNSDGDGFGVYPVGSSGGTLVNCYNGDDGAALRVGKNSNGILVNFVRGTTTVGSISVTQSTTAYNTSSDYRLKEDLQDFTGLDMVSKISVYDHKWKVDESRSYGVMAHELQEVLPQAVTGEKDAEEYQAVDYSKIVPVLVKAIQELEAKIKVLEQK